MPDSVEVPYPLNGVDVAGEFGRQRPGTTPLGVNVRAMDPILERQRGGSRHGLRKYVRDAVGSGHGTGVIQGLGMVVILDADATLYAAEDYNPDTFTTAPTDPGATHRDGGSGFPPLPGFPRADRNRLSMTASATTAAVGQTVTLTVHAFGLPGLADVIGGLITLSTQSPGQDGDGDTALTNGVGLTAFTVSQSDTGRVRYIATYEYTPSGFPFPIVTRTAVVVNWTEDLQIAVTSPDGSNLDSDGEPHPLLATLTRITDSQPVAGRTVVFATSPSGKEGDGTGGTSDAAGEVLTVVSDTTDEDVVYQARADRITGDATITWGSPTVQTKDGFTTDSGSPCVATATFDNDVHGNHTIFVGVRNLAGAPSPFVGTLTVSDTRSTPFTLVGVFNPGLGNTPLYLYAGVCPTGGPDTVTVTATYAGGVGNELRVIIAEYPMQLTTPGSSASASNSWSGPGAGTSATGSIAGSPQTNHLYVALVNDPGSVIVGATLAANTGFTIRKQSTQGAGAIRLNLVDSFHGTPGTPVNPTLSWTTVLAASGAVGACGVDLGP